MISEPERLPSSRRLLNQGVRQPRAQTQGIIGSTCDGVRVLLAAAFALTAVVSVCRAANAQAAHAHSVLLLGGRGTMGSAELTSAELFDPATGTFTPCKNKLSGPRMEHLAVSLAPR
jgi:hypothetical protein